MARKKEDLKPAARRKKGGCIKIFVMLFLILVMSYVGIHVYFLLQPVDKTTPMSRKLAELSVGGVSLFPALKPYDIDKIAGRVKIREGGLVDLPMLQSRLEAAVERKYPVTFREEEVNAWLSKRLEIKQGGGLSSFLEARAVWVNFTQDEVEIIIEREFQGGCHITSMFMQFDRSELGYSIRREHSHIGQVSAPGGFARLIMPAFDNLAKELAAEMKLYSAGKIRDIRVEEGKITFDPRRLGEKL